ncbi:hypothetical protein M514_16420, partial [Trichuris suis]
CTLPSCLRLWANVVRHQSESERVLATRRSYHCASWPAKRCPVTVRNVATTQLGCTKLTFLPMMTTTTAT